MQFGCRLFGGDNPIEQISMHSQCLLRVIIGSCNPALLSKPRRVH